MATSTPDSQGADPAYALMKPSSEQPTKFQLPTTTRSQVGEKIDPFEFQHGKAYYLTCILLVQHQLSKLTLKSPPASSIYLDVTSIVMPL